MKKNKKLMIVTGVILVVSLIILYFYNQFHIVSTYPGPYGLYQIEEGYRISKGDWHFNRIYRIKNQRKGSLAIKEHNWGDGNISQIIWFRDSVCIHYSGTEFELYKFYNLLNGIERTLDSSYFALMKSRSTNSK